MTPAQMNQIEQEQNAYLDTMYERMDNATQEDIDRFKACMNNRMRTFEQKVRILDNPSESDDEFLEKIAFQIYLEEFSSTMTIFGD